MSKDSNDRKLRKWLPEFLSRTPVIVTICAVLFLAILVGCILIWYLGIYVIQQAQSLAGETVTAGGFPPLWLLAIVAAMDIVLVLRFAYRMKLSYEPLSEEEQKGSRRFLTLPEIKNEYTAVPEKTKLFDSSPGFPVSRYRNQIFIDSSPVNNMVVGAPRSGKGETFVISAIDIYSRALRQENRSSLVLADPKGELAGASMATLEQRGYNVQILDLKNYMGMGYDPLDVIKEVYLQGTDEGEAEAQMLVNALSHILFSGGSNQDAHWKNWCIDLTNALILAVIIDCCKKAKETGDTTYWRNKINLYSVARLLSDLSDPSGEDENGESIYAIDRYFLLRDKSDLARIEYSSVLAAVGKTKGIVLSMTNTVLKKFARSPIARMTAKSSLPLKNLGFDMQQPTVVFMVIPNHDRSMDFLLSVFISQVYYVLAREASNRGGKCPRQVVFHLDEAGTIPAIPDLSNMLNYSLGLNIRFNLFLQSYSQLFKLYGQEDGKSIINGCGNQIYLLSIEYDTVERFSKMIGNRTETVRSRMGDPLELDKKINEHVDTKPLLNPNELMELKPGESVLVRITKRTDRKGNKVTPNPIFNRGDTAMKYRYEYLADDFDTDNAFSDLPLRDNCDHSDYNMQKLLFDAEEVLRDALPAAPQPRPVAPMREMTFTQLPKQKQERILRFLSSSAAMHDSRLELLPEMTLTQIEEIMQTLADEGTISQSLYEDIYTILST